MIRRNRPVSVTQALLLGSLASWLVAAGDPAPADADKEFDTMLAAAKAAPEKADWFKLRRAFTETTRYQPYNASWREELNKIRTELKAENPKGAEAALDKLMEREGYMRLDGHGLASAHYSRTGQKEKEMFHRQFAEGIASTLFVPGTGRSFEKPIVVLFVDEEYLFLSSLKLKAKRTGLFSHEGSKFDVFEVAAQDGGEPDKYYFNVDLPQKSLARMLEGVLKKKPSKD